MMLKTRPPVRPSAHASWGGAHYAIFLVALQLFITPRAGWGQQDATGGVAEALPPAGFGTLRQEDVALLLQTETFQIRILPLDERVTRLFASDTYESMHRLLTSKTQEVEQIARRYGIRNPTLFLVTFFGRQDRARFDPEILTITSQNRFFRPVEILPITPIWSGRQLNQRETASAVYVFEDGIQLLDPFTVSHGAIASNAWEQILRRLDRERASVLARAAAQKNY